MSGQYGERDETCPVGPPVLVPLWGCGEALPVLYSGVPDAQRQALLAQYLPLVMLKASPYPSPSAPGRVVSRHLPCPAPCLGYQSVEEAI